MWSALAMACMIASGGGPSDAPPSVPDEDPALAGARARMVQEQLAPWGITDARVLAAMARVPRHAFVPQSQRRWAYADEPLPIGHGQTISQPFIVAFMTQALDPRPTDRVLEVGTGSGYQAAVLSGLVAEVYTLERIGPLARRAREVLHRQGCGNVHVRTGDGFLGWPEAAPFDAILVTCAPDQVPPALVAQLKVGGRMVIPVGPAGGAQDLVLLRRTAEGLTRHSVLPVRFVPMLKGVERPERP